MTVQISAERREELRSKVVPRVHLHTNKTFMANRDDGFGKDEVARKREYAKARKNGGLNRRVNKRPQHKYHPIKSVKDVNEILESAINEARSLEISQSNLRTLAYLCQIALKSQELGSLEERVNAMEQQMEEREI